MNLKTAVIGFTLIYVIMIIVKELNIAHQYRGKHEQKQSYISY